MRYTARLPTDRINVSETDPRKEAVVLVAGVGVCLVAAFAPIAFSVDLIMGWVPYSWEARVFSGWDDEMMEAAGAKKHVADEAVQHLTDRLTVHWPEVPYRFRTGVIPESIPNALAVPGGVVLVTSGLLERVEERKRTGVCPRA